MNIQEARELIAALERGIAKAESIGETEVDFRGELSAELGSAADALEAAIKARQ